MLQAVEALTLGTGLVLHKEEWLLAAPRPASDTAQLQRSEVSYHMGE